MTVGEIYYHILSGPEDLQKCSYIVLKEHFKTKSLKKIILKQPNIKEELKSLLKKFSLNYNSNLFRKLEILVKSYKVVNSINAFLIEKNKEKISLSNYISSTINDVEKRMNLFHNYHIDRMKKENKKKGLMLTFFPKFKVDLLLLVYLLIEVRKIIINILREHIRYRGKDFDYMVVPEISEDNMVHLHMYVYEEFTEEDVERLQMKLEKGISRADLFIKDFSINVKLFDFSINYLSVRNNILNKMGSNIRANKILYFILIKMFGRSRFLTHSQLKVGFSKLKKVMTLFGRGGVFNVIKISYFNLIKMIEEQSDLIKIKIFGDSSFICLYDFLMKELRFIKFVSKIKVDNTILNIQMTY